MSLFSREHLIDFIKKSWTIMTYELINAANDDSISEYGLKWND